MTLQKIGIPLLVFALFGAIIYYVTGGSDEKEQAENLSSFVEKGPFKIFVNATGELKAKNSVKIKGPKGMRAAQVHRATITDMITEGTVVKAGDYVATLDKTEISTKVAEAQNELDKIETQLEQARIDTTIELRGIRNELINLKFAMEEKKLQVEQSKYEPQMVIQQAEIAMEKTERDYNQLAEKYKLTQTKALAQIEEIMASRRTVNLTLNRLTSLAGEFTIMAPKDGMIIYTHSWNGKVEAGSEISSWNPTVAELPDLSDMISKTYVNEVDISKIKKGQDVTIKVDAFPEDEYSGVVIQVANIGEQLKGYDSKVFEVTVQLNEVDSILRPAMTTSNEILAFAYDSVLFAPIEAIYSDSLSFVYKNRNGEIVKQEIIVGDANDDSVIVEHGLSSGDEFFFAPPSDDENIELIRIEPSIKLKIKEKLEKEKSERQSAAAEKAKKSAEISSGGKSAPGDMN